MPDKLDTQWAGLAQDATHVIREFFKRVAPADDDQMRKVKVATSVLSSYTRHEQTESAKEQTAVIVGRELAADKAQFASYLRLSVPRLNTETLKQLENPK